MNQPIKIPATATILIGGESKRFGSPKWEAIIDGIKLIDRTWDSCEMFENRFVVGKEKPDSISYSFIKDELDLQAPINGIYTALKYSKTDWAFLLSCDLPLIDSRVFEKLWESKSENCDAVIPFSNDKIQVTCGFYHKRVLSTLESEIEKKNYSIFKLLEKLNTAYIKFGNDNRFTNMNTQNDLDKIASIFDSNSF